jgi:hypothetical protein
MLQQVVRIAIDESLVSVRQVTGLDPLGAPTRLETHAVGAFAARCVAPRRTRGPGSGSGCEARLAHPCTGVGALTPRASIGEAGTVGPARRP